MAHYEADMYFEVQDKLTRSWEYRFDPNRLKEAHETCHAKTLSSLGAGQDVIVSNTFTRVAEMQPYLNMANKLQAEIEIYEMSHEPVLEKIQKNIHNVPDHVIEKMIDRWETLPTNLICYRKN